ncbi:hypothetical protein THOM_1759, partial [Trachipleistophora hominis]
VAIMKDGRGTKEGESMITTGMAGQIASDMVIRTENTIEDSTGMILVRENGEAMMKTVDEELPMKVDMSQGMGSEIKETVAGTATDTKAEIDGMILVPTIDVVIEDSEVGKILAEGAATRMKSDEADLVGVTMTNVEVPAAVMTEEWATETLDVTMIVSGLMSVIEGI